MKLKYESEEKVKALIKAVVGRYLDLSHYQVFVFGSRVCGSKDDRGDIDIGVTGPKAVPPKKLARIRQELEDLPFLYKIDLVDFSQVSDDFREEALQMTELL